jgi:hypothetical protein
MNKRSRLILSLIPKWLRFYIANNLFPEESNLIYEILRKKEKLGIMFDVGAGHGSTFIQFAKLGWKVF